MLVVVKWVWDWNGSAAPKHPRTNFGLKFVSKKLKSQYQVTLAFFPFSGPLSSSGRRSLPEMQGGGSLIGPSQMTGSSTATTTISIGGNGMLPRKSALKQVNLERPYQKMYQFSLILILCHIFLNAKKLIPVVLSVQLNCNWNKYCVYVIKKCHNQDNGLC